VVRALSARIAAGLAGVARRALCHAVLAGSGSPEDTRRARSATRWRSCGSSEIEPGVALGRAVDTATWSPRAGTFGDPLSLVRALGRSAALSPPDRVIAASD
jgi:hypothetical protein